MAGWTIVECSAGALYSTKWADLVSFKSLRLGPRRLQRCPVHGRFEMTRKVDAGALDPAERDAALAIRDTAII